MSTIAFDGKTIAFDTQITCDDYAEEVKVQKVFKTNGRIFLFAGGVGDYSLVKQFVIWAKHYPIFPDQIEYPEPSDSSFIAIDRDGKAWVFSHNSTPVYKTKNNVALGSGGRFALGAMAAGATAEQAIKIAGKFDIYTSGLKSFKLPNES